MKHKTSELTGALLDAAVAKAEGIGYEPATARTAFGCDIGAPVTGANCEGPIVFRPSTSWHHGGPIIEREEIGLQKGHGTWIASLPYAENQYGDTPLIAAMRAYVASKLGDEVDL